MDNAILKTCQIAATFGIWFKSPIANNEFIKFQKAMGKKNYIYVVSLNSHEDSRIILFTVDLRECSGGLTNITKALDFFDEQAIECLKVPLSETTLYNQKDIN